MKEAVIFFNGELNINDRFYKDFFKDKKYFYCADGGARYALEFGIIPLEVWGDFDSLEEKYLKKLETLNVKLNKYSKYKDFTDGELALREVAKENYDKIFIVGGLGGRSDHLLTNLNLIFKYKNIYFVNENEMIFKIENETLIENEKGKTISFIPMTDDVIGLNISGCKYLATDLNIKRGDSICNSNIITESQCKVTLKEGKILVIIQN